MVLSVVGNDTAGNRNFSHPIHLHGHSFYVVHIGHGTYSDSGALNANSNDVVCNDDFLCSMPNWRAGNQPQFTISSKTIRKDTVIVPAGGYVVIAFRANNPGYWFLHCHIESHQLEGMAVLIQEYPDSQHNPPPDGINDCKNFEWTFDEYDAIFSGRGASSNTPPEPLAIAFIVLFAISATALIVTWLCCCCYCCWKYRKNGYLPISSCPR